MEERKQLTEEELRVLAIERGKQKYEDAKKRAKRLSKNPLASPIEAIDPSERDNSPWRR